MLLTTHINNVACINKNTVGTVVRKYMVAYSAMQLN